MTSLLAAAIRDAVASPRRALSMSHFVGLCWTARDMDVVVVGAGVIGAAVAFRLAQAGARATVLEVRCTCASKAPCRIAPAS